MASPIVFFDIAGKNKAELASFYKNCFDWKISQLGQVTVEALASFGGAIR